MALLRSTLKALVLTNIVTRTPILSTAQNARHIARWVAPTLKELRRRRRIMGPQPPQPRSGYLDWNYRAELFAFSKRLHEDFNMSLLQTTFTERAYILKEEARQRELGIEEIDLKMEDNNALAERGAYIVKNYIAAFLQHSLPKLPEDGQQALADYLQSVPTMAHIAKRLGMKELIFTAKYPPTFNTLKQSLLAVVGALEQSSGVERAFLFVRDFICTQLNQKDLLELWQIENPAERLKQVCKEQNLAEPEPRLLGDCGKNTVLAAYNVGIYVDKKMIGKGVGEDITMAIDVASLDALQKLFCIQDSMKPFDFQLQVEPKNLTFTQN